MFRPLCVLDSTLTFGLSVRASIFKRNVLAEILSDILPIKNCTLDMIL
jgi:hypothetical protein